MKLRRLRLLTSSRFELLARDAFGFLVVEHGFDEPTAETFAHAEEIVSYQRGPASVDVRLGDGRLGIVVEVVGPDGVVERLGDERFQKRGRSWEGETRRLLGQLADELRGRSAELLGGRTDDS